MTEVLFAIPGDIATPTGGYIYDREVLQRLPGLGIDARHLRLPASYPHPSPVDLAETSRLFAAAPASAILLIDGLALGTMPPLILGNVHQPIVALVHHPLGYETGLETSRARELFALERLSLRYATHVIVTSRSTARLLNLEFSVPAAKIAIAEPGTDRAVRATGTRKPLSILAVGAISPRKGYQILIEALTPLRSLDWRMTIAGATDRDPAAVSALREAILRGGLAARVELTGSLGKADLARAYAAADLFVLPSLFEGYGMALAEAMARGLPIVCTTGGAAAETVAGGAALKVAPGQTDPLREALQRMLTDAGLRRRLGDASWEAGQRLPAWDDTARRVAGVLKEVATR